jgi:hypothetical protein
MGAAVLVALANYATAKDASAVSGTEIVMARFIMLLTSMAFGVGFVVWVAPFAACCLAIVEDTANGSDEVTSWPDYNILDWFFKAAYFPAAGFVAGLPGMIFGSLLVSGGYFPPIVVALAVLISWAALFPLVLGSMLAENSIVAVYSPLTYRSLRVAADAWMVFYLCVILLAFLAAIALAIAAVKMFLISSVGATVLVVLAFVFCRLMGRMMWVAQEKIARLPAEDES